MNELLHTIEKIFGVYRWHPKIALRYLPIVSALKQRFATPVDIIEVGSSGLGIAPYLKTPVVGVDLEFPPPVDDRLVPVKASALNLPFSANSFEAAISVDMLEHIKPIERKQAISELLRISRKFVVIGVPCGPRAHEQDAQLETAYKKVHGHGFHFLAEQVEYDLPTQKWLEETIFETADRLGKQIQLNSIGNISLRLRWFLMQGWISKHVMVNVFFRKVLLLAIPLMRHLNSEPTYRRLFFITIEQT
jgi:hypothetical protein